MIRTAAGVLGVDPTPWSYGELLATAHQRLLHDWDRAASFVWVIAEVNRDRVKRPQPYLPSDFHPLRKAAKAEADPGKRSLSRATFRAEARKHYERTGQPIPPELMEDA